MINSRQHRPGREPGDTVRVGRGERVLVDHRRTPSSRDDAGDVFACVNASQVLVRGRSRFDHSAALFAKPRRYGLKRFGALWPFRVAGGSHVIDKAKRADEHERHVLGYANQFSIRRPRTLAHSRSLAVTSVRSRARAWLAISRSLPPIGVPAFSSLVRTRA